MAKAPSVRGVLLSLHSKVAGWVKSNRNLAAAMLGVFDLLLVIAAIGITSYTEIDWLTYMEQVEVFLNGERDYHQIEGPTGPVVYPANFLYIFSALYKLTASGTRIDRAQIVFAVFHALNVSIVARTYLEDERLDISVLLLILLSRRVISIYVLRMFNDGVEALLANLSVFLFCRKKYTLGCIFLSLAVGVKMNGLLYVPAVGVLMVEELGWPKAAGHVLLCLIIQVGLGMPFVVHRWQSYFGRAFELGRVFLLKWSVNYAFLPEDVFQSSRLAAFLMVVHLSLLILFTHKHWTARFGGILKLLGFPIAVRDGTIKPGEGTVATSSAITALLTCNIIGLACARSIHYQFYAWYFHGLSYLLWKTALPVSARILILLVIELVYNVYPPHPYASMALHVCHFVIIYTLYLKENLFVVAGAPERGEKDK
ncbi:hypothetical protein NDN08_007505 [Rhodosorus marinus]|uniref:dolichyl-P-Man:Man5GlcNAc2-PP-dolichol alpha-1,3-mannosyltransferase n=1 Tax=Rhodosorus marinus TaxID=101924 RepID=A0AAV8V0K9_9RHOD|nr:hypothetical protein NDN08_007505 [Rhodosorus marinus]